jgi:hypothetical protein
LHRDGEVLFISPQNLVEFHNMATGPVASNGLGLTPAEEEAKAAGFERMFPLLAETPAIFTRRKTMIQALGVIGKQVHDARLVAICHLSNVTRVLTFNVRHFARFATYGPGITVVDPATV